MRIRHHHLTALCVLAVVLLAAGVSKARAGSTVIEYGRDNFRLTYWEYWGASAEQPLGVERRGGHGLVVTINDLPVGDTKYDVEFFRGTYVDLVGEPGWSGFLDHDPMFLGDREGAMLAGEEIMNALGGNMFTAMHLGTEWDLFAIPYVASPLGIFAYCFDLSTDVSVDSLAENIATFDTRLVFATFTRVIEPDPDPAPDTNLNPAAVPVPQSAAMALLCMGLIACGRIVRKLKAGKLHSNR